MAALSVPTILSVGLTCKLFLYSGLCSMRVSGLDILQRAIDDNHRRAAGQGVVTVCNHISTLDDPLAWGVLPARYYLRSHSIRWALGASEVMFTNPHGQTLETFRGKGIYQPSIDAAIDKLNRGDWVHLFGEGKINQPHTYPKNDKGQAYLPRFKWGVGRILMETKVPPIVIPMWITGFDELMPEGRPFPYNYIPRIGARLSVTFGEPVPPDEIRQALRVSKGDADVDPGAIADGPEKLEGWLGGEAKREREDRDQQQLYASLVRQKVTAIIQRDVEALARSVSGDSLWTKS